MKNYNIQRYDKSSDNSLRAWSAADEYLVQAIHDSDSKPRHLAIYNDRFGYLACHLCDYNPTIIITQRSQEKSIIQNLESNNLTSLPFVYPIASLEMEVDLALIKVPKSLDLFQLFLEQVVQSSSKDVGVICAFMTHHFSPQMVHIAEQYFEEVAQSRALKKARLLILTNKKTFSKGNLLTSLVYKNQEYLQYGGVFSGQHIDYATQFFLEHLKVDGNENCILDMGSGNGIIGCEISKLLPNASIHLMDDYYLAIASAQLNVTGQHIHHHYNNDLSIFEDQIFDLIVTNPPFHFEYEVNIQVTLDLFQDCVRCLKFGGNLQVVANKHLNYKTHLKPIFALLEVVAEDDKFIIYRCTK